MTIAALVGHSKGSVTSKYIHTLDTALIMAADTISGYIQRAAPGSGIQTDSLRTGSRLRRAALDLFLTKAVGEPANEAEGRVAWQLEALRSHPPQIAQGQHLGPNSGDDGGNRE